MLYRFDVLFSTNVFNNLASDFCVIRIFSPFFDCETYYGIGSIFVYYYFLVCLSIVFMESIPYFLFYYFQQQNPPFRAIRKEGYIMSTYEEFMIIININLLPDTTTINKFISNNLLLRHWISCDHLKNRFRTKVPHAIRIKL